MRFGFLTESLSILKTTGLLHKNPTPLRARTVGVDTFHVAMFWSAVGFLTESLSILKTTGLLHENSTPLRARTVGVDTFHVAMFWSAVYYE